jgi:hypothetical protein
MIKQLNDQDRAQLAPLAQIPGFKVFQTLCENELDDLKLKTFEARPTDTAEIVARHNTAQAAYIFYQNVVKRMNQEIEVFVSRQTGQKVAPDPTAALYE